MTDNWREVMAEGDFPTDGKHAAVVDGWHVLIVRSDGGYHAVNDRCTHMASPLSTGRVRRGGVFCPLHGARFDLASGRCVGGAYKDLQVFAVRVTAGLIEINLPSHPPTLADLPNAGA